MARNIEIKVYLKDVASCIAKAKSLAGKEPETIKQEDIFFNCDQGRLKLRIFSPNKGQLIFYNRENSAGPKTSEYYISETNEPGRLLEVLEKSYGVRGKVNKIRQLFFIGRARVHVDQVEDLGNFLEFEVILTENESVNIGETEAYKLMSEFGISKDNLIKGAYIDLITKNIF